MQRGARTVLALLAAALLAGCSGMAATGDSAESAQVDGRIAARPGAGGANCAPGEHWLRLGGGRRALMHVTPGGRDGKKALLLALHGAGSGGSRGGLYAFRGGWEVPGVVMVAPASTGTTWSFLRGRDTDLPFVDRALARAFARCRVDPRRVAVGGFSDGATYALRLGLTNGDLFRSVVALSPGGLLAERTVGRPRFFVAHGTFDSVLPKGRTSDRIVPQLRSAGYAVTYRTFRDGHEVVPEISRAAVRWLARP